MAKSPKHSSGGSTAVGYRRPPKAHQFKPGQSGNPNGRPKGKPTFQEVIAREAQRLVKMKVGDEIVRIPKQEALVRKLFALALEGNLSAARLLLQQSELAERASQNDDPDEAETGLGWMPDDEELKRMLSRFDHLRN